MRAARRMEGRLSLSGVQPDSATGAATLMEAKRNGWAQTLILAMLYSFPVFVCAQGGSTTVGDPDIWWHLRTGQWILQHGFPHTDPFTTYGASKPWVAYSWLFELLVLKLYQWMGLAGLVAYTAGIVAAITVVLHGMIRRLCPDFMLSVLLTLAACQSMEHLWTPRSWQFSVLFFVLEVDLLMQAHRHGKKKALWLLPPLFVLWANLHIVFLYGLAVLGIPLAEAVLARWWKLGESRIGAGQMGAVFLASTAATLVNPYGWRVYVAAYGLGSQQAILNQLNEMKAMPFRDISDFGVLLFALAAVAVLARARRLHLFEIGMLAFALLVSFRGQRDVWVVVIAASAIVADGIAGAGKARRAVQPFAVPAAVLVTAAVAPLLFLAMHVNNSRLEVELEEKMPVEAANFVEKKGLPGPLFNDFNWGGYLIWNPRLPVSMDGRTNLWSERTMFTSRATWEGLPGWNCNPDLRRSRVVIGPDDEPLTQLLRMSSAFELVYQDQVASVFVARPGAAGNSLDAQAGFPCNAQR
jgi:hypothetical protein